MENEQDPEAILDSLIEAIRLRTQQTSIPILGRRTDKHFEELLNHCVDLQVELLDARDDKAKLIEFKKKVFAAEAKFHGIRSYLMLYPSVMLLYCGIAGVYGMIRFFDIPGYITKTLGVKAPEKLITLGIAGAFLYLATSLLGQINSGKVKDKRFAIIADFTIRFLLAMLVPIVLVVLFFTEDGKVAELKLSPELLSFACGYSAKLVMDIFNKLVEKGSKMIDAI